MRTTLLSTAVTLCLGAGVISVVAPPSLAAGGASAVPRPDHVVVVVEENHSGQEIIGNPDASYINSLATAGANLTNFFAETHPSQPNYLALFSGSTQGVTNDACPQSFAASNVGEEALSAGVGFVGYSEGLPSIGYTDCTSGQYARKHNPWSDFTNVPTSANRPFTDFPTDYSQLPGLSIVIPNLDNDMHDGTIAQGDAWLQANLGGYAEWAKTHNSLLVLTFDEDDTSQGNQIPTVIVGQQIQPGSYATLGNHYNLLRTIEDGFGLQPVGASATAAPMLDIWKPDGSTQPFVSDGFVRSVSGGWGVADVGGVWSMVGPSAQLSVGPGGGVMTLVKASSSLEGFVGPARTDADVLESWSVDRLPAGGPLYLTVTGRRVSAGNAYSAKVWISPNGSVMLRLSRKVNGADTTVVGPVTVGGVSYTPGMSLSARLQVFGTGPTTLRARVWRTDQPEPSTWQVSGTDSSAALQAGGTVGNEAYVLSNFTSPPISVTYRSFTARPTAGG